MTKSEIIISEMLSSFNQGFALTQKDVMDLTDVKDNKAMLKKGLDFLYESILSNKIKHLEINKDISKSDALDELVNEFPIGLVLLDPVDFEGSSPLKISEMVDTGLTYILESTKKRNIKSLSFCL